MSEGQMPKIDWKVVMKQFELCLMQLLHRSVHVISVDVTPPPSSYVLPIDEVQPIDVDEMMNNNKADAIVIHGEYMVYFATLKSSVCKYLYQTGCDNLSFSTSFSEAAIHGVMKLGNNDTMQKTQDVVYTANFGMSERPQRNNNNSTNSLSRAITTSVGCHRGAYIPNDNKKLQNNNLSCLSDVISSIYHHDFYPFFFNSNITNEDKWYNNSTTKRKPRFMKKGFLDSKKKIHIPYPLKSSVPFSSSNKDLSEAASIESKIRNVSEWILGNVFISLPYSATAFIAEENINSAMRYCSSYEMLDKPMALLKSIERPLPKGAVGFNKTKDLHDDGNSSIIPGIWSSHSDDNDIILRFCGRNLNVFLHTTMHRFCFFMAGFHTKLNMIQAKLLRDQ
jgi:hypothetical protein